MRHAPIAMLLLVMPTLSAAEEARFTIAGEVFAQQDIVDARALPRLDGAMSLLITFDGPAVVRFERISRENIDRPIAVALDGKTVCEPRIIAPVTDGAFEMTCQFKDITDATAFAKTISGKDPLPDSLEE